MWNRIPSFRTTSTFVAALPLAVWLRDNTWTVCRVRGSSMEPTLKDGDVVMVRKSDFWNRPRLPKSIETLSENNGGGGGKHPFQEDGIDEETERRNLIEFEQAYCQSKRHLFFHKPPLVLSGSVVAFQNPNTFDRDWSIKRATALGGDIAFQKTQAASYRNDKMASARIRRKINIPVYSIWVEGDHPSGNSIDSQQLGAISKKLVVGIAEYVVWPPTRIQKIVRRPSQTKVFEF